MRTTEAGTAGVRVYARACALADGMLAAEAGAVALHGHRRAGRSQCQGSLRRAKKRRVPDTGSGLPNAAWSRTTAESTTSLKPSLKLLQRWLVETFPLTSGGLLMEAATVILLCSKRWGRLQPAAGFSPPVFETLHQGYSSADRAKPARTGFCRMYFSIRWNSSASRTRWS